MEDAVELTTFTTAGDAYVYAPLPPATTYGHRAELWNPDKWMQEVKIKVVTAGDHCFVRMLTKDTGELFAECPLPADRTPLTTSVEPVVDSSRYFVVKIVDRESRNHAFVGIGFRDRMEASDFTAALDDYRQYLRRKQEAEQLRQEFDTLQAPGSSSSSSGEGAAGGQQQGAGAAGAAPGAGAQRDFSLKPGETIHIKLSPSLKRGDSGKGSGSILRAGRGSGSSPAPAAAAAAPGAVPRLGPPGSSSSSSSSSGGGGSSSGFFRLQPPPPPPPSGSNSSNSTVAAAGGTSSKSSCSIVAAGGGAGSSPQRQSSGPGRASLDTAKAAEVAEDDWGDFVG